MAPKTHVPNLPALILGWVVAWAGPAAAATPPTLEELRHALATDPLRNLGPLAALRQAAVRAGDLATRLRVDELDCRTQTDLNMPQALVAAQAGLAQVTGEPAGAVREAWLRLRACRASARLALSDRVAGEAELNELIAAGLPGSEGWAFARLERGVDRSRRSDWVGAQEDLVAACEAMEQRGDTRDVEICLGQLASHYQRVNDVDEALRLMTSLQQAITLRGEDYDASIVAYNLASLFVEQERWDDALRNARIAERGSARLKDVLGQGYAGRVIALALMRQGKIAEALARATLALTQVDRAADEREYAHLRLTYAELLARTGRPDEALRVLDEESRLILKGAEASLREALLRSRALALATAGRWHDAYAARTEELSMAEARHREHMSDQAARLGKQFNRARDSQALSVLRRLNERERELRQAQTVALGLFGVLLLAVVALVVRKVRQVRKLQRLATTDELTGLMNRRALLAHAEQVRARAQRHGEPLALLMMDIDHFKRINDTHGHPTGDAVLQHVAGMLTSALRAGDRLGRVGGEEFVGVLDRAEPEDARRVAERMRAAVAQTPLLRDGQLLHFTISIGLACRLADEPISALLARADAALYRAKAAGRNAVAE